MDIFEAIKQDHDEARELMEELSETSNRAYKKRHELFDKFKLDMWVHHKVEEAVFYTPLMQDDKLESKSLEAMNEHHVANMVLEELETIPVDNENWAVKFSTLKEMIEHHMEEEENEVFPEARKCLSKELAKEMGDKFQSRKKVVIAALQPLDAKSA